jgi:hypothetical protein
LFGGGFGQADQFALRPAVESQNLAGNHNYIVLLMSKRQGSRHPHQRIHA